MLSCEETVRNLRCSSKYEKGVCEGEKWLSIFTNSYILKESSLCVIMDGQYRAQFELVQDIEERRNYDAPS